MYGVNVSFSRAAATVAVGGYFVQVDPDSVELDLLVVVDNFAGPEIFTKGQLCHTMRTINVAKM